MALAGPQPCTQILLIHKTTAPGDATALTPMLKVDAASADDLLLSLAPARVPLLLKLFPDITFCYGVPTGVRDPHLVVLL